METLMQPLVNGNEVDIEKIADQFVQALTEDRRKLEEGQGQSISDCAKYAPNLGTRLEERYGIGHIIARKCFPLLSAPVNPDNSLAQSRKFQQYILYKRLLRDLRNILRDNQQTLVKAKQNAKKKTPPPPEDAPLSGVILEPTAMPVEIPPAEEFAQFFEFLEQNQEIGRDAGETYPYTPDTRFLQFERGAVYSDQRMDLCKQVVGPAHISQLMTSLRKNQQIVHFLLGNNIIGKVGAQAIANYINDTQDRNHIKTWYLAGNDIDEEGMAIIAQALENDSVCQSLWLKRNPIKLGGVKHLAQTLTLNHTIKVLDLSNTGILDEGAEVLFNALSSNYGVRFLYLDANGLSGKTAGYIVEYITKLDGRKGVTSLWISMNRFHDDFISAFKALGDYKHLQRLDVGSARMGPDSARAIYEAFANHSRLKVLDVGMYKATYDMGELPNAMGFEGAKWLAKLIAESKSLRVVALNGNEMTTPGHELIARALAENNSGILFLDHFERKNYVDERIKDDISEILERNLRVHYGKSDLSKMHLQALKKRLRHGKRILDIDSVYRNRSKS